MNPSGHQKRRAFCRACIGGLSVASAGAVGFPIVSFLGFPRRIGYAKPVEVTLEGLPVGQAHYADLQGRQVVVLVREDGPLVLDAACTHLGCNVIWDSAEAVFRCPCHGAIFGSGGEVVSGPVNAPLEKIPFEVKDGKVIVT